MVLPETVLHELKFGIRVLFLSRWSTAITVLSLALGIGVNTAAVTAYGISAVDCIYFVFVSISFLVVALLASFPRARRAMCVDPVVALGHE